MKVSELVFVVGPDPHPRLADLGEALAEEMRSLGVGARIDRESLPAATAGRIAVILDPGRLRVGRLRRVPGARALRGAVLVHAGADRSTHSARATGAPAFDLDVESTRRRRSRGERATHLPIGWSDRWEGAGSGERDIDLALIGADRRLQFRALAESAADLARWRVHIAASAERAAPEGGLPGLPAEAERRALLGRARVVVDLERREGPRLDALRAAEAVCAGAVLVHEGSRALDPLEPGRDYV